MNDEHPIDLRIPVSTILKLLAMTLLVLVILKLWVPILMFVIAVLLAVMLEPAVAWMAGHGVRRSLAVLLVAAVAFGLLALFFMQVLPAMVSELFDLLHNLPETRRKIMSLGWARSPFVRSMIDRIFETPLNASGKEMAPRTLAAGALAVQGLLVTLFVLVVMLYLLVEGKSLYAWLVSYVPRRHRGRVAQTAEEVMGVIEAYMRGQVITCFLCAGWVLLVLWLLHVPAALPLAFIALVADIVPIIGTVIMTAPAVLLGLTVSPATAALVFAAYAFYHVVENYLIIPKVYGSQMRLSTLTVILAVAVGGTLQGVLGAVLILPIVAAYPIIERIWLRNYLGDETVSDHVALGNAVDTGRAADRVLEGEKPVVGD